MKTLVLDASVVLKWFKSKKEQHREAALLLRKAFEAGTITVMVPSLLFLELINVAGRRWNWNERALFALATKLPALQFEVRDAKLDAVARWVARGTTAYDAAYVALAEEEAVPLVTDDVLILEKAPDVAVALKSASQLILDLR